MNQQRPLKDEPILSESEFEEAILGAISDMTSQGRARKLGIALLSQALHAVNPLQVEYEDEVLYERQTLDELPFTSSTTPIQLDIKTGRTRHNFNDGYFGFTFFYRNNRLTTTNPDRFYYQQQQFITKSQLFDTQGNPASTIFLSGISRFVWKASDTSFFVYAGSAAKTHLYKVVGHKIVIRLKTP